MREKILNILKKLLELILTPIVLLLFIIPLWILKQIPVIIKQIPVIIKQIPVIIKQILVFIISITYRILIFAVVLILLFIPLLLSIDDNSKYNKGKLPVKDENKYFIVLKDNVFTEAIKKDNQIITVVNSSKNRLQLCPAKEDEKYMKKYMDLFLGNDSLALRTVKKFKDRGFEWVVKDSINGTYFSLPRKMNMEDKYDYVTVPVWLIKEMLDDSLLNRKKVFIDNRKDIELFETVKQFFHNIF